MGDFADLVLEGALCAECGTVIDGDAPGFPRTCADCPPIDQVLNR